MALALVLLTRILIPLLILKSPLLGSLLAILADNADIIILARIGDGISSIAYNSLDKALDMFTLGLMAYVIWKEGNIKVRMVGLWLFWYRLVGFVVYEILKDRAVLFIFPNIFEFFVLAWFITKALKKEKWFENNWVIGGTLLVCTGLKLLQEYLLHVVEYDFYGIALKIINLF